MDLPMKGNKSLILHYQWTFPEKKKKKSLKKLMGLPTKQNKNFLLHCQPSFPGGKIKKAENNFLSLHYKPSFATKKTKKCP